MCSGNMEVSREEAKRILRRLELEAYSSIVSTFRAQGDLNREKKKLLTDLGVHLSISTERHRAEVRRAYSDDRLGSVAECIVGPSTCSEWAAEGRRLVPLMPRLVPQTVLSGTATASANAAAAANAQLAQVKKVVVPTTVPQTTKDTSAKPSPIKQLVRQSSETVDVEYDSDDNKAKKKRKLSHSITSPKPVQKMPLNPSLVGTKPGAKTTSVSTSTMTKVGKPATPTGVVKATQKLMLPAAASQVKLLTKTVSITQNQAKTMLNYKTVTNPTAMKVQTVMSHTMPKTQVKMAVPATSKSVLVPKASVTTSPSKVVAGVLPIKTGITLSQLASKQRGKQTTRFKTMPGAVKFKSVTALAMGLPSAPVTMATTNISNITGSTTSTQPIVRVIQVPGAGCISTSSKTIPTITSLAKATALPISIGSPITKIPISTTQTSVVTATTQASRFATTTSTLPSTAKTVVMTTIVGGTKKVVLSVPAPVTPVQAKAGVTKTIKTPGLVSQPIQRDSATKYTSDKQDGNTGTKVPSLECTESSIPKQRPLQILLPAPPKPVIVAPSTTLSSNTRKLPQILPAPAKTAVLISTSATQAVTTVSSLSPPKVPLVQLKAKPTQPTVVTKLSVSKAMPVAKVSTVPAALMQKSIQQLGTVSETQPTALKSCMTQGKTKLSSPSENPMIEHTEKDGKTINNSCKSDVTTGDKETLDENKTEGDSNTSSEDDSLLVCSETIDCGTGLQDAPCTQAPLTTMNAVEVLAASTPIKSTDLLNVGKDEVVISSNGEDKISSIAKDSNATQVKTDDRKVIVEVFDSVVTESAPMNTKVHTKKDENKDEKEKDYKSENYTNLHSNEDKVIGHEDNKSLSDFDAVSSFLETFAGQSDLESTRKDSEHSTNIIPDVRRDIAQNENQSSHQHELKRTLPDIPTESSSLLSAFDVLDTPMTLDSEASGPKLSLVADHHALGLCQETPAKPDVSINVQSLKNIAQVSIEQTMQNSTNCQQNRSILSETSNACATSLCFSNNDAAVSNSDEQELTESERLALEAIANVRTSSRKRKPPSVLTLSPPRQSSGWIRGALSLLQKVCSYRGQGRKKGDYSAASWFLRPVDPNEAPGYFKVIKTPMDLSTIKTKLETGAYQDYVEFHDDVDLVRTNCFKYNPAGHDIRKDCEEVFSYFDAEYEKMLERWEKCHVSPAKKPRTMPKQELTSYVS